MKHLFNFMRRLGLLLLLISLALGALAQVPGGGSTGGPPGSSGGGGTGGGPGNGGTTGGPPSPSTAVASIISFSPSSGPVGTPVTVTGANLTGATALAFNGVNAPTFTVLSGTQLTVTVPFGATTGTIRVLTPTGAATSTGIFTPCDPFGSYNLLGTATGGNGCFTLTTSSQGSVVGTAWNTQRISLNYDFDFTFNVNQCGAADGMMFLLQNGSPTASNGNGGGGLGWGGAIGQSLGVEMDLWAGGSGSPFFDPDNSHMAVVTNQNFAPLAGPVTISPALGSCATRALRLTWNATTKNLTVYLAGTQVLTYSADVVNTIFGGNPNVFFGFTGATGGATSTQSFCPVSLTAGAIPTLAVTATPATITAGQTTTLAVTSPQAGLTYTWTGAGLGSTTGTSVTAQPTATTTYQVVATGSSLCTPLSGQVTVTVTALPTVPTITGFTPASGPAGTSVTVSGTNLGGATGVTFGGVAATGGITTNTATGFTVTAPVGAPSGPICVTTPGGTACSAASYTFPPVIATGPVTPAALCAGAGISVPFTTVTAGYGGSNVFQLQLSDASGSFAGGGPLFGTLTTLGPAGGTLAGIVPLSTPAGTSYRVRVVASNPATTGADNGTNITINTSPISQAGGPASVAYASAINLTLTPTYSGATYAWSGPLGFTSALQNPTIASATNVGVNRYTCVVTLGSCTFSSFVDVTVQAATVPLLTLTAFAGPLCPAVAFPLTFNVTGTAFAAGNILTAELSSTSGSFASPVSIGTVAFSGLGGGTVSATLPAGTAGTSGYRIRLRGSSPASTSNDNGANLTVNAPPTVTLAAFAPVCATASAFTLSGGLPAGGTYRVGGAVATSFNPVAAGVGTYTITYTATQGGCPATASQTLAVTAPPTVTLAAPPLVCANAAAFALSGGAPAGGTYSGVGVSGGLFNATVAGVGTRTITYRYTDGVGCSGTATQSITVLPVPTFASSATQVCTGQPVTLTVSNAGPGATYRWSPGGATTASITAAPTAATTYSVTVTNAAGCAYPFSQAVAVNSSVVPGNFALALPAAAAGNVDPAGGILSWAPAANATSYDVYVWPNTLPTRPTAPVFVGLTALNQPLNLNAATYATTYNWQVVASNGCFSRSSAVRTFTTMALPDLQLTALSAPANGLLNQRLTLTWTVRNVAPAATTGSSQWNDYVYLSVDQSVDPATDYLLGSFPNQRSLGAGQSYTQTQDVLLPPTALGGFNIYVLTNTPNAQCISFYNNTDSCTVARTTGTSGLRETTYQNNWRHTPIVLRYPPVPDLMVGLVGVPTVAFANTQITVTYRLDNKGPVAAIGNLGAGGFNNCNGRFWRNAFYLSQDSVFSPQTDVLVGTDSFYPKLLKAGLGSFAGNGEIRIAGPNGGGTVTCKPEVAPYNDGLAPDSSLTNRRGITLPHTLLSGTYYLLVVADAGNNVYEGPSKGNNVRASAALRITLAPPPDLVVTRVTAPGSAGVGKRLAVSWEVENQGAKAPDGTETTWYDHVYISRLPTFQLDSARLLGSVAYGGGSTFVPGRTYTQNENLLLPRGLSGQFYVYVWTDARRQVFEYTGDNNNITRSSGRVALSYTTYPDLVVTQMVVPDTIYATRPFRVQWTVRNRGQAATTVPFGDEVRISTDTTLAGNSYTLAGGVRYGGVLAPGQSVTQSLTATLPANTAYDNQRVHFFVRTDAPDEVYEYGGEDNNLRSSQRLGLNPAYVKGLTLSHDLQVTALSGPVSANSGTSITVAATVRNNGPNAVAAGVYWSDNVVLSADTLLDVGDQPLTQLSRSGPVAVAGTYPSGFQVTLPNGLSGNYYLLYVAAAGTVAGLNDTQPANNVRPRALAIALSPPADLVVASLSVADTLYAGQTVRVPFRLANLGTGPALPTRNPWFTGAYLSTTPGASAGSPQVGSQPRTGPLAAGASVADSVLVRVPATYLGNYYLVLRADNANNVYEHNAEGNNARSRLVFIKAAPQADLVMTALTVPGAAVLGNAATMTYTVRNAGLHPTLGSLTNNLYWSPERGVAQAQEKLFGADLVSTVLAPGQQLTRTVVATPRTLRPGYYRGIAQANALQNVPETNYANNRLLSPDSTRWQVTPLVLSVAATNLSLATNQHLYYQLTVGAGLDLLVTLTSAVATAANEVYVAYERIPTTSDFDYKYQAAQAANQEAVVPDTRAGRYFIYLRTASANTGSQGASLLAVALPYSIRSITPAVVGQGRVTTTLNGAGFRTPTQVRLRNAANAVVATAQVVSQTSSMVLTLRWNLTAVPTGTYTVETQNPNGAVQQLANGLRVVVAKPLAVDYLPNTPGNLRAGGKGLFSYTFRNTSNVDIPVLHAQFSMAESVRVSDVLGTDGHPLLGSAWSTGRQLGLPVRDWYAPGDGLVYVPIIARNVRPGAEVTVQFSADLRSFRGGQLSIHPVAYLYQASQLLTRLAAHIETVRRAMVADPVFMNVTTSPQILALLPNRRAFTDSMLTRVFEIGLLQPTDTVGSNLGCDTCLGLAAATAVPTGSYTFSPGIGPGPDTLNRATASLGAGGSYLWHINKYAGVAGRNPGWDLIRVSGPLAITATATQPFVVHLASLTYRNLPGLLAGWYPAVNASWPLVVASGGITGFAANKFAVNANLFTSFNNLYGGTFALRQAGDTLKLTFTAFLPGAGVAGVPGAPGAPGEAGSPGGPGGPGNGFTPPGRGGAGGTGGSSVPATANTPAQPAGAGGAGGAGGTAGPNQTGGTGGTGGNGGLGLPALPGGAPTGGGAGGRGGSGGSGATASQTGAGGRGGNGGVGNPTGTGGSGGSGSSTGTSGSGSGTAGAGLPAPTCNRNPPLISSQDCEDVLDFMNNSRTVYQAIAGGSVSSSLLSAGIGQLADQTSNCGLQAILKGAADAVDVLSSRTPAGGLSVFGVKDALISSLQFGLRLGNCVNKIYFPDNQSLVQDWVDGLDCVKGGSISDVAYAVGNCAAKKMLCVPIVTSCDPNEIVGPNGYGVPRFVAATARLPYKVTFENDKVFATTAAQRVNIRVPIDANLNALSVRLGDVSFNNRTFRVPANLASYNTVYALTDSIGVDVELTAGVDVDNREVFWEFQSIDRRTGLPPANPLLGFLPPNDSTRAGEGAVLYSVRPRSGAVTGDSIRARAAIVFDINDVIVTNRVFNVVDAVAPASLVLPITAAADSVYQLRVTRQDDPGGSGVRSFDLYVSQDGQNYVPFQAGLTTSPVPFTARAGQNYYFYALATDNVGNVEGDKSAFEAFIAPCPFVTGLQAVSITTTTASATFTGNALATGGYLATATPTAGGAAVTVQGNTSPLALTGLSPGTSYSLTVRSNCGGPTGVTSPVLFTTLGLALPDLLVSTNLTQAGGSYRNVTIVAGGSLHLTAALSVAGVLRVDSLGVLDTRSAAACALISGLGSCELRGGATLRICDPAGISLSGATGSVQLTGTRSFSPNASYVYDGLAAQVTGPGLPAQVRNLANVGQPLTLSQAVSIVQVLEANAAFNTGGRACTLLSSAQGTALVKYNATTAPAMTGDVTVQRYIDPASNPGAGYRHYSSPVVNPPFADLTTAGFTPTLNAAYNTAAQPNFVTPFPTVFGYDESRVATVTSTYGPFDKGWFSPSGSFVTGRGYTVNIPATEKVDFVGALYNGTLSLPLSRTPSAEPGWHLLGNPYAAPLDWSLVPRPSGLDAAMYVLSSTGRYTGVYRTYVNGVGSTSPVVPSSQGFFVRATAAATLTVSNAARVAVFRTTDPTFQRGTADLRPQLHLRLQAGSGAAPTGLPDDGYLYFETGATAGLDAAFDAVKLLNPTGLNLASVGAAAPTGLAVNGLPPTSLTVATAVPLHVGIPASGTYTLRAAELLNLPPGFDVVLVDLLTGQRTNLRQQPSYQFAATATAPVAGRFFLNLTPAAGPLATAAGLSAATVSIFPNPAHQDLTVLLPAVRGAATVQATLLSVLGQSVRQQQAALPPTGTRLTFDLTGLATGVYVLRLQAGSETLTRRVVVE